MTVAICLRCGRRKHGALTPCPACDFEPRSPEDQAKATLLSDHFLGEQELVAAGARIEHGEEPELDPRALEQFVDVYRNSDPRLPVGCHLAVWTPFAVLVLVLLFCLALLLRPWTGWP
jgi:hypothetical protein